MITFEVVFKVTFKCDKCKKERQVYADMVNDYKKLSNSEWEMIDEDTVKHIGCEK